MPKINVIPQDLGRVLLNLINNAFYAVNQQNITQNATVETVHALSLPSQSQYQPTVIISTKKSENQIKVKDNGTA